MPRIATIRARENDREQFARWRDRVVFIGVTILALSCAHADRATGPVTRLTPRAPAAGDLLGIDSCGSTCTLFNSTDPLWSAIANPDSAAIPVSIADIGFAPIAGDSVVVNVVADSTVMASLVANETLSISDGTTTTSVSLQALASAQVVWRFASSDSTTLHINLNRALAVVGTGGITVTANASAAITSATRPWVANGGTQFDRQVTGGRSISATRRSNDTSPGCTASVSTSGAFCSGSGFALFSPTPVAPANAFGAAFQSPPPGHGASGPLMITFIPPVAGVTVTVADPTFDGNQMEAFDISHTSLGVVAFPGNHHPGINVPQAGTLSGAIKYLVLTPANADYVAYNMSVTLGGSTSVTVASAAGRNPNGSFTTMPGEDTIHLKATVSPSALASRTKWTAADDPGDHVNTSAPASIPDSASSSFVVPHVQDTLRLSAAHPASLDSLALALQIKASVTDDQGVTTTSAPATVRQGTLDAMREEYVELHHSPVPTYSQFTPSPHAPTNDCSCLNAGDFDFAIFDPIFMPKLDSVQTQWTGQGNVWQNNVIYRSAAHNKYHAPQSHNSGVAQSSPHMWGCAADIQTFPVRPSTVAGIAQAMNYWHDLVRTAKQVNRNFAFENAVPGAPGQLGSGYNHVHIGFCPGGLR